MARVEIGLRQVVGGIVHDQPAVQVEADIGAQLFYFIDGHVDLQHRADERDRVLPVGGRLSLTLPFDLVVRASGWTGELEKYEDYPKDRTVVYGLSLWYRNDRFWFSAEGFRANEHGWSDQLSGYAEAAFFLLPEKLQVSARYEAARVDGATELQVYRHIIIPLLQPITLSAVIVLGHISLKIFDLVVSMTGSGPAFATDVPAFFMWDTTFRGNNFAQGAAIATILLVMVAILIVPYLIYTIRTEAEL